MAMALQAGALMCVGAIDGNESVVSSINEGVASEASSSHHWRRTCRCSSGDCVRDWTWERSSIASPSLRLLAADGEEEGKGSDNSKWLQSTPTGLK